MTKASSYFPATRHPWPCTMFLIPMLLAYESGVLLLGGAHPESLRNGADNWMRFGLTALGLPYFWLPPLMLVVALFVWNLVAGATGPKTWLASSPECRSKASASLSACGASAGARAAHATTRRAIGDFRRGRLGHAPGGDVSRRRHL